MIEKFKFWCHKVLPLAYDNSLSYYEVLCKLQDKVNEVVEWINTGFANYIEEAIGDLFVDTTYDESTETLNFSFDEESEGEESGTYIARIGVNDVVRQVKDVEARGDIADIVSTLNTVAGVGQSNILVVAKSNARFNTVNDAIAYAKTYCTTTNRVTIVIVGGNVIYNEAIDLDNNPGIDLLGISRPIIRSSVAWRLSALRCSNSIRVEGIEFENYYTPSSGEHAGYGLHADPVTGTQTYTNCAFYSNNNAGAGLGTGQGGQINFNNCTFRGTQGVYLHNNTNNNVSGQWIRFVGCSFSSFSTNECIRVYDAATAVDSSYTSQLGLQFVNCYAYPNAKVRYIYNGSTSINYVPRRTAGSAISNGNIFLTDDSCSPGIPGVDYGSNIQDFRFTYGSYGNDMFLTIEGAHKFSWSCTAAEYSDNGGTNWSGMTASTVQLLTYNDRPNQLLVRITGTPSGRVFRLDLRATPR